MRLLPGILCIALALAACGEQSAQEERAAWARDADAICEKAQRAIAERGAPTGPEDLIEVSKESAADARDAADDVLALKVPEKAGRPIGAVREAMRSARPSLDDLARLGPRAALGDVTELVEALDTRAEDLPQTARATGLRTCGAEKPTVAGLDGIKAPLFEIQFTEFAKVFKRKLAGHRERGTASVQAAGDAMIHIRSEIGVAQVALDDLLAPAWAEDAVDRYKDAVLAFRAVEKRANEPFLDGKASPANARDAMARLARSEAKLSAAARTLQRELREGLRGGGAGDPA